MATKPTTNARERSTSGPWMPSTVAMRAVESLIPYARNARTHSAAQVAQIAASIREFGWTNPVLVASDGTIIAGHGRVLAARQLGLVEVPVIELGHLSETQRRALVLADNQLALTAGWDDEMLATELRTLLDDGFALPLLGFDESIVERLVNVKEPPPAADERQTPSNLKFQVLVECVDEWHQAQTLEKFENEGYQCRLLTL